jgi:hypothetical protein
MAMSTFEVQAAEMDCPAGSVCVWDGEKYAGAMTKTDKASACKAGNVGSAVNNSTALTLAIYGNPTCEGASSDVAPGAKAGTVTPAGKAVMIR